MREFNKENFLQWIREAVIGPAGEKYFDLETGEVLDESGGGLREIYEVEDECYLAFDETDDGPLIFPEGIEQNIFEGIDINLVNGYLGSGKFYLIQAIKNFKEIPELSDLTKKLQGLLKDVDTVKIKYDTEEIEEPGPVSDYISCQDSCGYPHICIPFKEEHIEDIEYEVLLYFNCPATISLRDWLNREES